MEPLKFVEAQMIPQRASDAVYGAASFYNALVYAALHFFPFEMEMFAICHCLWKCAFFF